MAKQPPTLDEFFEALEETGSEQAALARIEEKTTEWLSSGSRKTGQSAPVRWISDVPQKDDFGQTIANAFIDGRTKYGPWAIMTIKSHRIHGIGLGTGKGQRYDLFHDGSWQKTEG